MPLTKEVIVSAIHSGYLPGEILAKGVDFNSLFEVLEELGQAKPGDYYYKCFLEEQPLDEIDDSEVSAVIAAIKGRGYPVPVEYQNLSVEVPERIYKAWESLESPYTLFRQLIEEIKDEDKPLERTYLGKTQGEFESSMDLLLPDLSQKDIDDIEAIPSVKGERGDADWGTFKPKVRAILERMVAQVSELEPFRRPDDWTERGHKADEDLWPTTFSAPYYVGRLADKIRIARGTAHSGGPNFSVQMREWLDELTAKDIDDLQAPRAFRGASSWYTALPGGKESVSFITKPVISLTLAERQRSKLAELVTKGDRVGSTGMKHGQFLSALLMWGLKIDQTKLPHWKEWEEFCEKRGNVDDIPAALKSLEEKGYMEILS